MGSTRQADAIVPWIKPWPSTFHVTDLQADCESFRSNHWVYSRSRRIFVVVLEAGIVREVVTLREDALDIELLKLSWLDDGFLVLSAGVYCIP